MNEHRRITIAVLTTDQDNVERINRALRDGGHAAHCKWIKSPGDLDRQLQAESVELIITDCDGYGDSIRQVVKQKDAFDPETPVIAVPGGR